METILKIFGGIFVTAVIVGTIALLVLYNVHDVISVEGIVVYDMPWIHRYPGLENVVNSVAALWQ